MEDSCPCDVVDRSVGRLVGWSEQWGSFSRTPGYTSYTSSRSIGDLPVLYKTLNGIPAKNNQRLRTTASGAQDRSNRDSGGSDCKSGTIEWHDCAEKDRVPRSQLTDRRAVCYAA